MTSLADRLAATTARERLLLSLLLFVVIPAAAYSFMAVPLLEARDNAAASAARAREMLEWVIERDAAWTATDPRETVVKATTRPVGLSGIETSLTEAGLRDRVDVLQNESEGRISIRMGGVAFVELGRYLETLDRTLGYDIANARIRRTDAAGLVDVELQIAPETSRNR